MGLERKYCTNFEYYFWNVYPKKIGKPAAEKEFLRLKFTEDQMRELREHVEVRKRHDVRWNPNKEGKTFIVDPERFLKHRRFEDEYERIYIKPTPAAHRTFEPQEEPHTVNPEIARRALQEILTKVLH